MKIRTTVYYILTGLALLAMVGCSNYEGDQHIPAYLHIDSIALANDPNDSWSTEDGFFTHNIDAAEIVIWQEGDTAEQVLGVFTLPCTVPILKQGNVDRVRVSPCVPQSGISGARIYYPYYQQVTINDVRFAPDSITSLGTVTTHYKSHQAMSVKFQEFFEPWESTIRFKPESVIHRISNQSDTVRSGRGCGVVRMSADERRKSFTSVDSFYVSDPSAYIYLEMDVWSDFNFKVGFSNPKYRGGPVVDTSAYTRTAPSTGWEKYYIVLGRLWSWYSYYPYLKLWFAIYNDTGKEGKFLIDNVKVVVM